MSEATATVHDPVCHMDIDPRTAAGRSDYEGEAYYFCSGGCKVDFDADPAGVLRAESEYDHSQAGEMMMDSAPQAQAAGGSKKKPWWKLW